jgi:DNA polymerase III subunit delta'
MLKLSELKTAQPHAVEVLSAAVRSGRLHHAYILAGPVEAGADTVASALATSLVCSNRQDADGCGACSGCKKATSGSHPDILRVAPDDKGGISIDAVRLLTGRLGLKAAESLTKVVIITRADAMNSPAQNALLKTLEEPPGATCFLLTTARWRALLPTVRSRSLTLRLAPLPRLGAWPALVTAGIPLELARPLAALVGPDAERSRELVELGAPEVLTSLKRALRPDATLETLLGVAADLGADRQRTDLALAMLEVEVRDRLAHAYDTSPEALYLESPAEAPNTKLAARLALAAERLQELRQARNLNLNRTLGLESLLMLLTGRLQDSRVRSLLWSRSV